jgi:type II secretion system protein C
LLTSAGVFALVSVQSLGYLLSPHQAPLESAAGPQTAMQQKPKPKNTAVYKQISNWHLFGVAAIEENSLTEKKAIDAPETNLNLTLLGVLFNPNQEESRAIIAEQGKSHKSYKVGDPLPRKATLYSIEAERVILSRNGKHESLKLKKLHLPGNLDGNGFSNHRMASPAYQAAENLGRPPERQRKKTDDADPDTTTVKARSALGKLPTPPSKPKILRMGERLQDV